MTTAPQVQPIIDAAWAVDQADAAAQLADAQAATAAAQLELAAYQQKVLLRWGPMAFVDWDETKAGTLLDLAGLTEVFRDDFDAMSIVNIGQAGGKWWAAGHATFDNNIPFRPVGYTPDPYLVANGECRIRMEYVLNAAGVKVWQTGIIQTVDKNGEGWAWDGRPGAYFEMRAKYPMNGQKGAWPAFWMLSNDAKLSPATTRYEIDFTEAYGSDAAGHHATVHYKRAPQPTSPGMPTRQTKANYVGLRTVKNLVSGSGGLIYGAKANMFDGNYWTYGMMIGETITQSFVNGFEVCRMPTQPWMLTPGYLLVNLAMLPAEKSVAVSPQDMTIDYVRVMAKA